jgi:Flp pilus assembly protein TadD
MLTAIILGLSLHLSSSIAAPQAKQSNAKEQRILQIQNLMQQGNLSDARKRLSQSLKEFPADPGFDNLLGIIEAREKNYNAAEAAFQRAVARAPKFTGAYLNLGRLYQESEEYRRALLSGYCRQRAVADRVQKPLFARSRIGSCASASGRGCIDAGEANGG